MKFVKLYNFFLSSLFFPPFHLSSPLSYLSFLFLLSPIPSPHLSTSSLQPIFSFIYFYVSILISHSIHSRFIFPYVLLIDSKVIWIDPLCAGEGTYPQSCDTQVFLTLPSPFPFHYIPYPSVLLLRWSFFFLHSLTFLTYASVLRITYAPIEKVSFLSSVFPLLFLPFVLFHFSCFSVLVFLL